MTEQEQQQQQQENARKRRITDIIIAIMVLILVFALSCFIVYFPGFKLALSTPLQKHTFTADSNSEAGDLSGLSDEEIVAALNEKVQEGTINISMNTNPIFADGKSKGTLMITNSTANRYPQMIEIYIEETGELIYSGGVEIGHKIELSALSVDLPKGDYDCIAYFHAVNPDTGERVGTAGANIKITIES